MDISRSVIANSKSVGRSQVFADESASVGARFTCKLVTTGTAISTCEYGSHSHGLRGNSTNCPLAKHSASHSASSRCSGVEGMRPAPGVIQMVRPGRLQESMGCSDRTRALLFHNLSQLVFPVRAEPSIIVAWEAGLSQGPTFRTYT